MAGLFGKEHKRGVLKGIERKGGVFGQFALSFFYLRTEQSRGQGGERPLFGFGN